MAGMGYFKSTVVVPNFSIRLLDNELQLEIPVEQQMFIYQLFTVQDGELILNGELIII
jgi:hypothetical protein